MDVDWYACDHCGDTFADCGYYVMCEGCGRNWCSDDCAEADGYECPRDEDDERVEEESTCGYCRKEVFEDSTVLAAVLKYIGMSREEVVEKLRKGEI